MMSLRESFPKLRGAAPQVIFLLYAAGVLAVAAPAIAAGWFAGLPVLRVWAARSALLLITHAAVVCATRGDSASLRREIVRALTGLPLFLLILALRQTDAPPPGGVSLFDVVSAALIAYAVAPWVGALARALLARVTPRCAEDS